jgi:hypothetical protein
MHCYRLKTADSLFGKHRDLFPFPVKTRLGVGRPVSVMAIALLLSLTSGVVYSRQAEPGVAVQLKREPAANPFADFVAEAARRFGVPALWINAVMMVESGGEVRAVSPQGAMGLMQIMRARELPAETQLYVATLAPMTEAPQVGGTVAIARRETPWQESALFTARDPRGVLAGLSPLARSDRGSGGQSAAGQFALQPRPDGLFVSRASARPLQ